MKKVSNPLTIIGIFAGIAEVAGTIVLPNLKYELQIIFIYYVMLFPIFLVALFFIVLWKKPAVLYAPSDYHDEKNFVELIQNKIVDIVEEGEQKGEDPNETVKKIYNTAIQDVATIDFTDNNIILLLKEHPEGLTITEISEHFSVSRTSVRRRIARLIELEKIDRTLVQSEAANGVVRSLIRFRLKLQE